MVRLIVPLLVASALCACTAQPPLDGRIEPYVAFESGTGPLARTVADALPDAMRQVAQAHRHRFLADPSIRVFATDAAFEHSTGYHAHRVAGVSSPSGVSLAPQPWPRLQPILLHELSHVLLRQWIGSYRFYRTPIWFREGLATWAAGGGGAGSVTPGQAAAALRSGAGFEPNLSESLVVRKDAAYWGLSHHMFYRQAALFIDHLVRARPAAWRRLLQQVHAGTRFKDAWFSAYSDNMARLWPDFLRHLGRVRSEPAQPGQEHDHQDDGVPEHELPDPEPVPGAIEPV